MADGRVWKLSDKARILLFTGEGKGKTTAALGMGLRASGHGVGVLVVQFIKGAESGDTSLGRSLQRGQDGAGDSGSQPEHPARYDTGGAGAVSTVVAQAGYDPRLRARRRAGIRHGAAAAVQLSSPVTNILGIRLTKPDTFCSPNILSLQFSIKSSSTLQ